MLGEGSSSLVPFGTKSKLSLLQNSLKPFHQDLLPPRACASPSVTSSVFLGGVMVAPWKLVSQWFSLIHSWFSFSHESLPMWKEHGALWLHEQAGDDECQVRAWEHLTVAMVYAILPMWCLSHWGERWWHYLCSDWLSGIWLQNLVIFVNPKCFQPVTSDSH